jgi:stalled ribosome alternative rescue factor ArfA
MKKNKKIDKRMFKKSGEELQQYLLFKKRGSRVENRKGKGSYNRQKFKKGNDE